MRAACSRRRDRKPAIRPLATQLGVKRRGALHDAASPRWSRRGAQWRRRRNALGEALARAPPTPRACATAGARLPWPSPHRDGRCVCVRVCACVCPRRRSPGEPRAGGRRGTTSTRRRAAAARCSNERERARREFTQQGAASVVGVHSRRCRQRRHSASARSRAASTDVLSTAPRPPRAKSHAPKTPRGVKGGCRGAAPFAARRRSAGGTVRRRWAGADAKAAATRRVLAWRVRRRRGDAPVGAVRARARTWRAGDQRVHALDRSRRRRRSARHDRRVRGATVGAASAASGGRSRCRHPSLCRVRRTVRGGARGLRLWLGLSSVRLSEISWLLWDLSDLRATTAPSRAGSSLSLSRSLSSLSATHRSTSGIALSLSALSLSVLLTTLGAATSLQPRPAAAEDSAWTVARAR